MAVAKPIIPGQKFNRLTYLRDAPSGRVRRAIFRCDCGREVDTRVTCVRTGVTKSCGCIKGASNRARQKHGHALESGLSSEYESWQGMKYRCERPSHKFYRDYGGRGIKVCVQWKDFRCFLADMGQKPSTTHSLDRIDPNGNYEPSNCRWATLIEQANNRRTTPMVEYKGRVQSVANWARELGVQYWSLYARLFRYRWPIARAMETPFVLGRNQFD